MNGFDIAQSAYANPKTTATQASTPYNPNQSVSKAGQTTLDLDDFLQLIVAQFQNQDPENAADTSEMMDTMMNMTVMQAITNVTDATSMLYTSSLVGKEVTIGQYGKNGLEEIVGTVTASGTYNGKPVIFVDDVPYNVSDIMAVGRLPQEKTEAKPETKPETPPSTNTETKPETKPETTTPMETVG